MEMSDMFLTLVILLDVVLIVALYRRDKRLQEEERNHFL
jgi:hypothetical protein